MRRLFILIILLPLISCGKSDGQPASVCKPQEIAIAECLIEEYERNPSPIFQEYQKQYCQRLYPTKMCYYR